MHVHEYGEWTINLPTCTEEGYKQRSCSCGKLQTETLTASGHAIIKHEAKEPTCTEIGWDEYVTCENCKYTTYAELPPSHAYVDNVCTCGSLKTSEGLSYELLNDNSYAVSDVGTCNDSHVVIPEKYDGLPVTVIGEQAFLWYSNATKITIPNSVTTIGNWAFFSCQNLTDVTIPSSVVSIGDSAFNGCYGLTNVTIPDSVISIGESSFRDCLRLETVTIGKSVTSIGREAFALCDRLQQITLGNSLTSIEYRTFAWCDSLKGITIPDSVLFVEEGAFYDCESLEYAVIGNSVTTIGKEAFAACYNLTSVTVGNSVTSIKEDAFRDCSNLKSVYIESIEAWCNITFDTEYNAHRTNPLYSAKNLYVKNELVRNLVIPDTVTEIKGYAFYGCTCLLSVIIPESVKSIGYSAFYLCSNLTSVTFENKEGWSTNSTSISATDLEDYAKAATYLRATYTYSWSRN